MTDAVFGRGCGSEADLESMLSLRLKACLVNLTNVQHLHKKLWHAVVQMTVAVNDTAQLYLVNKDIDANELEAVKNYLLNPVDSRFKISLLV